MNKMFLLGLIALLGFGLATPASYAAGTGGKNIATFNAIKLVGVAVRNPQGRILGVVKRSSSILKVMPLRSSIMVNPTFMAREM